MQRERYAVRGEKRVRDRGEEKERKIVRKRQRKSDTKLFPFI